jgi:predicted nuclease of predicted toxin-antitoxin system
VKFKPDENLPVPSAAILASAGHDAGTVLAEGLTGATDQDVGITATAAVRVLISLDLDPGDIRAYPPGRYAGIVIPRLADQSAATVTKAISDLASPAKLDSLARSADHYASAIPDQYAACLAQRLHRTRVVHSARTQIHSI